MISIINIYLVFNLLINIIVYFINKDMEENIEMLLYFKSVNRMNIIVLVFFAMIFSLENLVCTIILILEALTLLIFYAITLRKIKAIERKQK